MSMQALTRAQADGWIAHHHHKYHATIVGGPDTNAPVILYIKNKRTGDQWFLDAVGISNDIVTSWPWNIFHSTPPAILNNPDFSLEEIEEAENILASLS